MATLFNQDDATTAERDSDGIKRKFIRLKNHKKPTCGPDCPPEVIRAKRIQREIENTKRRLLQWMMVCLQKKNPLPKTSPVAAPLKAMGLHV